MNRNNVKCTIGERLSRNDSNKISLSVMPLEFEGYLVCIMQLSAFMSRWVKNTIVKDVYLATDNDGGNAIFAVFFNRHGKRVSFINYDRITDHKSSINRSVTVYVIHSI